VIKKYEANHYKNKLRQEKAVSRHLRKQIDLVSKVIVDHFQHEIGLPDGENHGACEVAARLLEELHQRRTGAFRNPKRRPKITLPVEDPDQLKFDFGGASEAEPKREKWLS